ncbi:MAG: DUF2703 domain-containing protein [Candidatus Eremiobacteraeota bacterium]|nr:DUF2703 domain-containing protein [Candidatus Eremiobacteraeota bacterium]
MIVDLLFFEGCPNHGPTLDLIGEVLAEQQVAAKIRKIEVADEDDVHTNRFLGSPTVRVDGVDIEPSARSLDRYGMTCRVYHRGDAVTGTPPRQLIEDAIRSAVDAERQHVD